ncbi:MAG: PD-(D/E)XK nuclease family protein [Candidatus Campbellbacteria bacterium]|nr:PD-(D/E)XK nuclease family protein [Candidatus Campbellbacteria bacterium]
MDKDLVEFLFWKQGLNPTAVNKYLACPWEYFFLTLMRLPQPPNRSAVFGTAVHKTLQEFFDERTKKNDLSITEVLALMEREIKSSHLEALDKEKLIKRGS